MQTVKIRHAFSDFLRLAEESDRFKQLFKGRSQRRRHQRRHAMTKMHARSRENILKRTIHEIRTACAVRVQFNQARRQITPMTIDHACAFCRLGIKRCNLAILHQQASFPDSFRKNQPYVLNPCTFHICPLIKQGRQSSPE